MRGVIKIRNTRFKKYGRKNRNAIILAQLLCVGYIFTFGIHFLTFNTEAYFNDNSQVTGKFQAGTWENEWDKSSLKFNGNDQTFESCNQKEITVALTNMGSDMEGPSQYEVYYIDKGNPKDGEKGGDGVIDPILAKKSISLKFTASKPGNYKFRAFQRPNHAFKDERQDLWSETITITCKTNSSNESQQNQINNNQGKQTETQPSEDINKNDDKTLKPEDSDTNQTGDSVPSQNDLESEGAEINQSGNIDSSQNDSNSIDINPEMSNTSP
jgi:YqxM protein